MTRPSTSRNWYEPGASGIVPGSGRSTTYPFSRAAATNESVSVLRWKARRARFSGARSGSEADNPAVWRPGCHPPASEEPYPETGRTHMLRLQAPLPDDYTLATPDDLVERIAAAKETLGDRL